jgi:hypothetical protein
MRRIVAPAKRKEEVRSGAGFYLLSRPEKKSSVTST